MERSSTTKDYIAKDQSTFIVGGVALVIGLILGFGISALLGGNENGYSVTDDGMTLTLIAPKTDDEAPIASGKEVTLTAQQLKAMLARVPLANLMAAQQRPNGVMRLVREQIAARTVLRDALTTDWALKDAAVAKARQVAEKTMMEIYLKFVSQPEPGYPEKAKLEKVVAEKPDLLKGPREVNLAQIFIGLPKNPSEEDQLAVRKKAIAIHEKVTAEGADFGALASLHSDHKDSAMKGGEAGWITDDKIVPELRAVISQLKINEVSQPIQTAKGIHIVKNQGVRPGPDRSVEQVVARLRVAVRKKSAERRRQALVKDLASKQSVEIDADAVKKVIAEVIASRQ
ncbi:MAG: peptidylprolyl isomerase [Parvibaculaceae bacterium]|nr:peptidylprolyl isomerase [Parvibaculaceae bacterium]